MRNAWRLDALDKWRDRVDGELQQLRGEIQNMNTSEKIRAAVSDALGDHFAEERTLRLSAWQRFGAFAGGLLLVADLVRGIVG